MGTLRPYQQSGVQCAWDEEDSGKLGRLRDIAEVVAARQEKALVFTQFKETTAPLVAFLGSVFGRPGLVLQARKRRLEFVLHHGAYDRCPPRGSNLWNTRQCRASGFVQSSK